ncbi:WD40 repeat protein [Tothia fuscella]|uniref:WD40 repeat protein n=1 Tax=Tothia fuscella TaxID=1048955 RepID=A0A9P4NK86_9PEZI|nr:WD40 repeat protein [Tothia fuscella]
MSKQYLTIHTLDSAHPSDIFSLSPTPTALLSASGSSTLKVHSTTDPSFPLLQTLPNAHKLGCHHITTSSNGLVAASAGFGGEVKVWKVREGEGEGDWVEWGVLVDGSVGTGKERKEVWGLALDGVGRYLSGSSFDGRVRVWDLNLGPEGWGTPVREYETKGSFGLCVAMSQDGKYTASGHENGSIYVFNNETSRLLHSLPGLILPVRSIAFSPASTLLAAGGDSTTISLYAVSTGERILQLSGNKAWVMSLDFNHTGEYLLSGSYDGKAKVWSVEGRNCVATHGESEGVIWGVKWLPKQGVRVAEMFVVGGKGGQMSFFREASGG